MTPTEMLVDVMGKWGEHGEPIAVLIVYTDTEGDVWMKTNCPHTHAIGMAEYAKGNIMQAILDSYKDGEGPK